MSPHPLPIDAGLLTRFRSAGKEIAWRRVDRATAGRTRGAPPMARIAHLHDEEARVEETRGTGTHLMRVDSGPVGALTLLLEMDRRGVPVSLETAEGGARPGFAQGAIEARWGGPASTSAQLPLRDLVELARYALA